MYNREEMKKIMVLMFAVWVLVPSEELMAQSEQSLYFYHDGRIIGTYACSDIDSITFSMESDVEWTIWRENQVNKISAAMVDSICVVSSNSSYLNCPDANHPHWIDLGLPSGTQWRCCNEGASTPEDYGGYYTFGQAASAPTSNQIEELVNYSSYEWTTQNGVRGERFTGPNGGSVFLPAAGLRWGGSPIHVGSFGYYWSSTPYGEDFAYELVFGSGGAYCAIYWLRDELSVRPVR